MEYELVSADSHVNEPPDTFTSRVPAKYRARAPRMESFPKGDAWILEGSPNPVPFGRNACAGLNVWSAEGGPYMRWEAVHASATDPAARLAEQDLDGVAAEVLFPTPSIQASIASTAEPGFHLALVRAYNDWLSDYCGHFPDRLLGLALVPNRGVAEAVDEFERAMGLPGIMGGLITLYPHGDKAISPDDDPLWAAFQAAGLPVTIHVSLTDQPPAGTPLDAPDGLVPGGIHRFFDAPQRLYDFIYTGVMQRFADLEVVFAETDAGWVPCWKEQAYNRWRRKSPTLRKSVGMEQPPTAYTDRFHFTYITDNFAIRNRHEVGVGQIMWSSDYPHSESDFPYSWRAIQADFAGVPADERQLILAGNCLRLYGRGLQHETAGN